MLSAIQDDGSALWPAKHNIQKLERMEQLRRMFLRGNIAKCHHRLQVVFLSLTILKLWTSTLPTRSDPPCTYMGFSICTENEGELHCWCYVRPKAGMVIRYIVDVPACTARS